MGRGGSRRAHDFFRALLEVGVGGVTDPQNPDTRIGDGVVGG